MCGATSANASIGGVGLDPHRAALPRPCGSPGTATSAGWGTRKARLDAEAGPAVVRRPRASSLSGLRCQASLELGQERGRRAHRDPSREDGEVAVARDEDRPLRSGECDEVVVRGVR